MREAMNGVGIIRYHGSLVLLRALRLRKNSIPRISPRVMSTPPTIGTAIIAAFICFLDGGGTMIVRFATLIFTPLVRIDFKASERMTCIYLSDNIANMAP